MTVFMSFVGLIAFVLRAVRGKFKSAFLALAAFVAAGFVIDLLMIALAVLVTYQSTH